MTVTMMSGVYHLQPSYGEVHSLVPGTQPVPVFQAPVQSFTSHGPVPVATVGSVGPAPVIPTIGVTSSPGFGMQSLVRFSSPEAPVVPQPSFPRGSSGKSAKVVEGTPPLDRSHNPEDEVISGVGVYLSREDGNNLVQRIVPGCAADRCGLILPGDVVVSLAEQGQPHEDVRGIPLRELRERILGVKGTTICVTFRRESVTEVEYEVELVRGSADHMEVLELTAALKGYQVVP